MVLHLPQLEEAAMESNAPSVENFDERLIVVGVDGSACATRAVEFAARQAAQNDSSLLVVSVYHEMPAAEGTCSKVG